MLNTLLLAEELDLSEVRLLRHKDNRSVKGCDTYAAVKKAMSFHFALET
jgi:hypothetical protein